MTEIHFFERNPVEGQISIEKLFSNLYNQLENRKINYRVIKNPYTLSQFWKALWFFKRNQGSISHITGDIHWACLFLDSNTTVLTIHDLVGMYQYKGLKRRLYYLFWVYLPVKKLKYITAISDKTRDEILKYIPAAKNKILVIPNFVTVPFLLHNTVEHHHKPTVLIIGTRANKNIERILNALLDIGIEIIIIGKIEEKDQDFIEKSNLSVANFTDLSEEELVKKYAQSDILLFPSLYEGFGLPILEAQAQNTCVITSDISPMKEIAGEGAVLVNPFSVEEIRDAVIRLVENKKERECLIEKGKENVIRYSPEKISEQYINLYKKILKG